LPRSELARLVQVDYAREMAFIALDTADDGTTETLGVVRAVSDPDNVEAEFAILVRSDIKGRRLGTVLLRKMIDYLRRHGTQRMTGYVLSENEAMRNLVATLGFNVVSLDAEPGALLYQLDLQPEAVAADVA
jgi:acetyltransferase